MNRRYFGFTEPQVEALRRACELMMTAVEHGDYTGMTPSGHQALQRAYGVLSRGKSGQSPAKQ